jgi:hypothetical protein
MARARAVLRIFERGFMRASDLGFRLTQKPIATVGRKEMDFGLIRRGLIESIGRVFSLLLAGGDPLLPFVIGDERQGDQEENREGEEEFHGWE